MLSDPKRKALIRQDIKKQPEWNAKSMKMQPGVLAIAIALINGSGQYLFNHKATKGVQFPFERLLNENDAFVGTDYKVGLITENPDRPGIGVLQSAPSQFNFPAQTGQLDPADLEAIYSLGAKLSLKVQDITYTEGIPTWPCRYVGTDQATEHAQGAGLVSLEPYIILDGSKKSELKLEFPTYPGSKVQYSNASGVDSPTTKRVYLVLMLDGFLVTNGSNLGNLAAAEMTM